MSDNEYKDLQNFGKTIEKKPEENIKEKKTFYEKLKPTISYVKKKTMILIIKLVKIIIAMSKWTYRKIKKVIINVKNRNHNRRKIRFTTRPKQKTHRIAYKIVETRKQRRNKMIIIRKRVPFDYNHLVLQPKKTDLGALFYLTFKEDNATETRPEAYTRLKDSVWDFPVENKRKNRVFFSFWNVGK